MTLHYINTVPCDDCGIAIDYLNKPWYPLEVGGLCVLTLGRACGLTGIMPAQNGTQEMSL